QTPSGRIGDPHNDDRNGCRGALCRLSRRCVHCHNRVHLEAQELADQLRKSLVVTLSVTDLDTDVPTFVVAEIVQSGTEVTEQSRLQVLCENADATCPSGLLRFDDKWHCG